MPRRKSHVHCPNHPEYELPSELYGCPGCLAATPPVWWYAQPTVTAPKCYEQHPKEPVMTGEDDDA